MQFARAIPKCDLANNAAITLALNNVTVGGDSAPMTVTLSEPVAVDTLVTLSSSDPSAISVPANITVLATATQATFIVTIFILQPT
jgi:hypothetical protein